MTSAIVPKLSVTVLFVVLIVLLPGCFSFRAEYPPISWIELHDRPLTLQLQQKVGGAVLMRPMTSAAALETNWLISTDREGALHKHRYFRWTAQPSELVHDKILQRLTEYRAFEGGILEFGTATTTDYILEMRLLGLEIGVHESPERKTQRKVALSLSATFIKNRSAEGTPVLFQRVYADSILRDNLSLEAVGRHVSECVATIGDAVLADMIAATKTKERK